MFIYKESGKRHSYELGENAMTGVTTVLSYGGSTENLQQWGNNLSAAQAFRLGAPAGFVEALEKAIANDQDKKLSTRVAQSLDKEFPAWKEARTWPGKIARDAASLGTEAHEICELYERGTVDMSKYSEPALRRAEAYITWFKQNIQKTHFVEMPLFSKSLFLGGTPDGGFLMNDGRSFINDKKFKAGIYDPKPFLQMAAYRMMIEEMSQDSETPMRLEWSDGTVDEYASPQEYLKAIGAIQWDGSVVILIGDDCKVQPMYRYAYEEDKQAFLACMTIYRHFNNYK